MGLFKPFWLVASALLASGAYAQSSAPAGLINRAASEWHSLSLADRSALARVAAMSNACRTSYYCDSHELQLCIDETTAPPTPPATHHMSIGELAARCIIALTNPQ